MMIREILKRTGIPRNKLYYLEKKGYIKPVINSHGRLKIKDYSKDDFVKIQTIWHLLQQGMDYRSAFEKAIDVIDDR